MFSTTLILWTIATFISGMMAQAVISAAIGKRWSLENRLKRAEHRARMKRVKEFISYGFTYTVAQELEKNELQKEQKDLVISWREAQPLPGDFL